MLSVAQQTIYKAFGLRISSEIPLPELPVSVDAEERASPDIVIEAGIPDRLWGQLESIGSNFARIDNSFLFLIPETAFYCIEDGRKITVSPLAGADPEKVRVYLLGTCMGALLMIRNTLPCTEARSKSTAKRMPSLAIQERGNRRLRPLL